MGKMGNGNFINKNFPGKEIKTGQSNLTLNNYTNMYVKTTT